MSSAIHARADDDSFTAIDNVLFARQPRRNRQATCYNQSQQEAAFLSPHKELPLNLVNKLQQRWDVQVDKSLLFEIDPPDIGTQTVFHRGGRDFHIVGYEETAAPKSAAEETRPPSDIRLADTALSRTSEGPGHSFSPSEDAEEQWLQNTLLASTLPKAGSSNLQRVVQSGAGGLLEIAPGFQRGIQFASKKPGQGPDKGETLSAEKEDSEAATDLRTQLESPLPAVHFEAAQDSSSAASKQHPRHGDENHDTKTGGGGGDDGVDDVAESFDVDMDQLLPVEFPSLQPHHPLSGLETKKTGRQWAHMVDLDAESLNFRSLIPGEMARQWPFELDAFQKEAIYHLESGDSVFVAAHTSAGKTVVAEYAIALAQKHQTKAIYTSPIKALSNQKFRDFKHAFDDVGLLTGDVQINQEAKCLIMTTEILRSKLYSQSDLLREVEFVIFDEVHYVSDTDRGVVWEEVIIMLPEQVSLILLSATVPNTYEFASWVGRTKKRDVYVISTPKRPVPLEHYLWDGKAIQKIVNAERTWVEKGYREAKMLASGETPTRPDSSGGRGRGSVSSNGNSSGRGGAGRANHPQARGGGRGGRGGRGQAGPPRASHNPGHMGRGGRASGSASLAQEKTLWSDVVRFLRKSSLLPACIFVFSRVRCEEFAMSLSNLDFCDASEKTRIHSIYSKSVSRLAKEDQDLPQITRLRDMAKRGIAVHHGGLLPIVKEIVELLFAQSLVKVLFATETFAVGLNLPTRTVVFSDHRKFDGTKRRVLSPGEYTQMAGRAGRRGLDSVGTAIIVPTGDSRDVPPAETLKTLILGQPARLTSQFRLTYNMILSLHRVETLRVEDMMKQSFSEHASQNRRPEIEQHIHSLEVALAAAIQERGHCPFCARTMGACQRAAEAYRQDTAQMYEKLAKIHAVLPVFNRGRLVVFIRQDGRRAAGVVAEDLPRAAASEAGPPCLSIIEIQPPLQALSDKSDCLSFAPPLRKFLRWPLIAEGDTSQMQLNVVKVPIGKVEHAANCVLPLGRQFEVSSASLKAEIAKAVGSSWESPTWNEVSLDKVRDIDVVWCIDDRLAKANAIALSEALQCPDFVEHYALRHKEWTIQDELAQVRRSMDDSNLALLPEYQNRIGVLEHLGFVNASSVVMLKGRVACEIRTADELVLTEAILNNLLSGLEAAEIAALLSIFVYQGKDDTDLEAAPFVSNRLTRGLTDIYRIWKDVMRTQEQFHVIGAGEASELSSKLHFGLMEVVYEWASGSPFKTITSMTSEQEGTIVRTITRLEETCREVRNIGRIIGDTTLETKMNGVREAIMRNITTVPSLYL